MSKFNQSKIQEILKSSDLDGWLLYDFRGVNDLALNILDIIPPAHITRRFYYFIPKSGKPSKIVNGIEAHNLAHLPGNEYKYSSHISLSSHLKNILGNVKTIAMEYSPMNSIPYLSRVDAGTIEFIRSFGVNIVSSKDLITKFQAVWSEEQYKENIPVGKALTDIVTVSFNLIKEKIIKNEIVTEYSVQQFILNEFQKRNYFTDFPPIVAVNENSANPHYAPDDVTFKEIKRNDFVLIDLWAKQNKPDAVWSDITWVGFVGDVVPSKYKNIFNIVAKARDAAFNLVVKKFQLGEGIKGYEVDDAARNVITNAGYGNYFIHRTGHSITIDVHGSGAHMDNFETKDDRTILPSTSFSIEPGIYLPNEFGVRSEIDVYIHPNGNVEQTGGERQKEVIAILN
jgi:Xaa-Pro aminopeptidase